jgi:hypothetical protein
MDLDSMKRASKEIRAPQMAIIGAAGASNEADTLLRRIQVTDEREQRQMRKALPLYLVAASTYALACIATFVGSSSGSAERATHFGVLAAIFMTVGALMLRNIHTIRRLDYSLPVHEFLAGTLQRYRFMRLLDLCYSIPLLIVLAVTGGFFIVSVMVPQYFEASKTVAVVIVYAIFFAGVCCMGFYFTYKNWRRDKGGIFEEIQRIRRELESPPSGEL